jgi:hypothetical protein
MAGNIVAEYNDLDSSQAQFAKGEPYRLFGRKPRHTRPVCAELTQFPTLPRRKALLMWLTPVPPTTAPVLAWNMSTCDFSLLRESTRRIRRYRLENLNFRCRMSIGQTCPDRAR